MRATKRRRVVVDDSALAQSIGQRIRAARVAAGLTQQQLAEGRYTKAYVSALEKGHAKPSMAALNFLSERLGLPAAHFLGSREAQWTRLEADLLLAAGRWQEAADAYNDLLDLAADRSSRAELLRGLSEALCRLGRAVDAVRPATQAVELFREQRRERDAVLAGYWLANAFYLNENTAEARSILRSLLDQLRGGLRVEPDLQMRLLVAIAMIETWDGEHRAAITYLEEARGLSADLDDRRRAAFLAALGLAYQESGDMEGAIRASTEALALYRAADAEQESAALGNHLANAYLGVGSLAKAKDLVEQASERFQALGNQRELAHVYDTQARIRLAENEPEAAIKLARKSVSAARDSDNRRAMADAYVTMARAAVAHAEPELALGSFEQAAELLRDHGPRMRLQQVLGEWAELLAQQGEHAQAYELTREALSSPEAAGAL